MQAKSTIGGCIGKSETVSEIVLENWRQYRKLYWKIGDSIGNCIGKSETVSEIVLENWRQYRTVGSISFQIM